MGDRTELIKYIMPLASLILEKMDQTKNLNNQFSQNISNLTQRKDNLLRT